MLDARPGNRRLRRLDDERLAALVRRGDAPAFEALYDRHHASLLAFCRHMVGNREDGEDALQQTFLRAHQALMTGRPPDSVRPWLFAIARNRCRTLLAARKPAAVPADEVEVAFDGLADDVRRRADLRELVADLAGLPEDQRGALVLHELGDLSHAEIATVLGCAPEKVKALVFQARTALIAEREARATPCDEIRGQLEVARGGALRRGPLRRHLRQCEPCASYQVAVARQRVGLAVILPVAPSVGLKAAVLGGAGAAAATSAGVGGAAGTTAVVGGAAAASSAGVGGGAVAASTVAVKALAAKVAIGAVVASAGVSGGAAVVDGPAEREPVRVAAPTADPRPTPGGGAPAPTGEPAPATTTEVVPRRTRASQQARRGRRVVRHRRVLRRSRRFVRRRFLRRAAVQRRAVVVGEDPATITGDSVRRPGRGARRRAREDAASAERDRRRRAGDERRSEPGADEIEAPAAEDDAPAPPDPRARRRRSPAPPPAPTPEPTPSPTPEPTPVPTPEPTPEPESTPSPEPPPPGS